jgi:hypothetical protein
VFSAVTNLKTGTSTAIISHDDHDYAFVDGTNINLTDETRITQYESSTRNNKSHNYESCTVLPYNDGKGDHAICLQLLLLTLTWILQTRCYMSTNVVNNTIPEMYMTHIPCVWQAPLRSEAPLLLEIFYNIFEGVDAKALLDAKPPQDDDGNGQAKSILAREKAVLKTTGTKSVCTKKGKTMIVLGVIGETVEGGAGQRGARQFLCEMWTEESNVSRH